MGVIRIENNLFRKIAILDNCEGDINSIVEEESSGNLYFESMLKYCRGYLYFKTDGRQLLSFINKNRTLEALLEESQGEIFIHYFEKKEKSLFDRKNIKRIEFHCGGKYRQVGISDETLERIKHEVSNNL